MLSRILSPSVVKLARADSRRFFAELVEPLKQAALAAAVVVCGVLSGCSGAPPEVRAGDWTATEEEGPFSGSFTFTINPEGTAIEDVEYSFTCGEQGFNSSNLRMSEPRPLDGRDLEFGVYLAGQVPMAVWHGQFSPDGRSLSGSVDILGDLCQWEFEITR